MNRSDDEERILCVHPDVSQRYDAVWIMFAQRVYEGELYVFGCGDETFESGQCAYGTGVGGKSDGCRGVVGDVVNKRGRGKRTGDECQLGKWLGVEKKVLTHFSGLDTV